MTAIGGFILFMAIFVLPIAIGVLLTTGLNPFEAYSDGKKYHRKLGVPHSYYSYGTTAKELYEDYAKKPAFIQDVFALGIEAQKRKDARDKVNAAKRSERFEKLIDKNE